MYIYLGTTQDATAIPPVMFYTYYILITIINKKNSLFFRRTAQGAYELHLKQISNIDVQNNRCTYGIQTYFR